MPIKVASSIALALLLSTGTNAPAQHRFPWHMAAHAGPLDLQSTVSGSSVALSWTNPGEAVDSWIVEAGSGAGLANLAILDTGSSTPAFSTTGVPAGTYFVRVRGRFGATTGPASNEITLTVTSGLGPCGLPAAPGGLTSTVSGSKNVTLNWNAATGATGHVVEAGSTPGSADTAVADVGASTSLTAAAGPGSYFVRVRGRNQCGLGSPSNEVQVFVGAAPGPGPAPCAPTSTTLSSTTLRIAGTIADSDCAAPHRSGHKADLYTFDGLPGTIVSITMYTGVLSSTPYLILVAPDGSVMNEAAGLLGNAFLNNIVLPAAGSYTIEATSLSSDKRFAYTLTLRCSPSSPHCS